MQWNNWIIVTSHLESPLPRRTNERNRTEQIQIVTNFVEAQNPNADCVFLGDLNICAEREWIEGGSNKWKDCGTDVYTYDALVNENASNHRSRPDRFLLWKRSNVEPSDYVVFGTTPEISTTPPPESPPDQGKTTLTLKIDWDAKPSILFPSDHFGISCRFT